MPRDKTPYLPALILLTGLLGGALVSVFLYCGCRPDLSMPAAESVVLPPPSPLETAEEIRERKRLFIALLLPLVQAENRRLEADRTRIDRIESELNGEDDISQDDFEWLKEMARSYELDPKARRNPEFFASLRQRVDIIPASLAIAQAAIESGWGRSQVTREANNFFGHYCYGADCGVPAPGNGDLRVFASPAASVHAYIHNLNSHPAYHQFRLKRAKLRASGNDPGDHSLAGALTAYSERGDAYIADIQAVIRANKLHELANR